MTPIPRSVLPCLMSLLAIAGIVRADVKVVMWSAPWCAPCKQMQPIVERLQAEGYPIEVRNYDSSRPVAHWQGVNQIPACVVFRDGEIEMILQGVVPEADLRALFTPLPCDPADAAQSLPLPGPVGIEDLPEAAPPTPRPDPPRGPSDRKQEKTASDKRSDVVIIYEAPQGTQAQATPQKQHVAGDGSRDAAAIVGGVAKTAAAVTMPLWAPYIGGGLAAGAILALATSLVRRRVGTQVVDIQKTTVESPPLIRKANITYRNPPIDDGLTRMRLAMKDVSDYYPAARSWVKLIEQAYTLRLSGEATNGESQ